MRIETRFRATLYGVFAVLFATGAAWWVADRLKGGPDGERWQQIAANLLMIHGGAAMVALLFLGALGPVHIKRGWRANKNRFTGIAMSTFNAVLVVSAFGLYYLGSDNLRSTISLVHLAVGLGLPAMFLVHVVIGKGYDRGE